MRALLDGTLAAAVPVASGRLMVLRKGPEVDYGFLRPEPDGVRLAAVSRDKISHLARDFAVSGRLRIDAGKRLASARLEAKTHLEGERYLPLRLRRTVNLSVSQDGKPLLVLALPERKFALVALATTAGATTLSFSYDAPLSEAEVSNQHIALMPGSFTVPWSAIEPPSLDLVVTHDPSFELMGNGLQATANGTTRIQDPLGVFLLCGYVGLKRKTLAREGLNVTIAVSPDEALDAYEQSVSKALDTLAPLGPFPTKRLTVIGCPEGHTNSFVGRETAVLEDAFLEEPLMVAHELAHAWFGAAVRNHPENGAIWYEAVANWIGLWAGDESYARTRRYMWSDAYLRSRSEGDPALLEIDGTGANDAVRAYFKGGLVMSHLELRLGRDRLTRVLHGFYQDHRGQRAGWLDLAAAVEREAGPYEAVLFREWLTNPGAPELSFGELDWDGDVLRGSIEQRAHSPFRGTVEILARRTGDDEETIIAVPFAGPSTPFAFALDPRSDYELVLDPNTRLPKTNERTESTPVFADPRSTSLD